jgi:hypothetical protein
VTIHAKPYELGVLVESGSQEQARRGSRSCAPCTTTVAIAETAPARHPPVGHRADPLDPDWIDTWNQDPRPFVWTKTADEILDSITQMSATNL